MASSEIPSLTNSGFIRVASRAERRYVDLRIRLEMEKMEKFEMEEEWRGDLEMGKEKVAGNSDREWKFWWLRAVYVMVSSWFNL